MIMLTAIFLITPMCSNTQFRMMVHSVSTDLHLKNFFIRTYHSRMQRLIVIVFRLSNIIIKFRMKGLPLIVNNSERHITFSHSINQYAHRTYIKNFIKINTFCLHFPPNTVNMFRAAINFRLNASIGKCVRQAFYHLLDIIFSINTTLI